MAIQISGTSVIFDNRNIDNVGVFTATSFVGDGSNLSNLPASGGSITATASGAISNGDPVVINTDGTVSAVSTSAQNESFGSAVEWRDYAVTGDQQRQIAYDTTNNKIAIVYKNSSNYPEIVIGTVSGSSITFGTPVAVLSEATPHPVVCYDPDEDRMVVLMNHKCKSGQISGNSITFGSTQEWSDYSSRGVQPYDAIYDTDQKKIIYVFRPNSGNPDQYKGHSVAVDVDGDTLTFGYEARTWDTSATVDYATAVYLPHVSRHIICYEGGSDEHGQVVVGALDGSAIAAAHGFTYESKREFDNVKAMFNRVAYDSDSQKAIVAYSDDDASRHVTAKVIDVVPSGRAAGYVSIGPRFRIKSTNSSTTDTIGCVYDPTVKKMVFIYQDNYHGGVSGTRRVKVNTATVDGFNLTMDQTDGSVLYSGRADGINAVYDPDTKKVITSFEDQDDSDAGDAYVITTPGATSNLTSTNFLGISNAAYSDGDTATIQTVGAQDDAQSGLTVGKKHYVNRDGSISTTQESPSALVGIANASTKIIIGG